MNPALPPIVRHCTTMTEVREGVDALDARIVPLLAQRVAYMTQAARIKPHAHLVRDEERIEAIVAHVRALAAEHRGEADVIEAIYRHMMEECIAYEHREFARLRAEEAP
ncbi:MAG: chorismate mutase [Pseudomonadota bacterium]|nr:chorismate mutase [Pseudomonadota bacterium]